MQTRPALPVGAPSGHDRAALRCAGLLTACLLGASCDSAKPPPIDPGSAEGIVASLEATRGPEAAGILAYEVSGFTRTPEQQAALLGRLDLSRFEHAYFLTRAASVGRPELPPGTERALATLRWPPVPSGWTAEQARFAYNEALSHEFTSPFSPGLTAARSSLAARLWPIVSGSGAMPEALARARRTPLGPLVDALTREFDLRIRVTAEGPDELAARVVGEDFGGRPLRTMPVQDIQAHVRRRLGALPGKAVSKLGLGITPECGADFESAPALVEVNYELRRLDRVYESEFRYAHAVRLTATLTLHAGGNVWTSAEISHESGDTVMFDRNLSNLGKAVLDDALSGIEADLLELLVKEE